jgi:hypothetical protein
MGGIPMQSRSAQFPKMLETPCSLLKRRRNSTASSGMSSRRSRKGGKKDRHHADAIVKIGAEVTGEHSRFQVPVGRGHQPHIHLDGVIAAHALELAFLQHAQQLGLKGRRDLPDLIQKQRAAVGHLEAPLAQSDRAGKRSALVAEELRLQHRLRQRRAVQADIRLLLARRVLMNGAREQLLARARLAAQQHRQVAARTCWTFPSPR